MGRAVQRNKSTSKFPRTCVRGGESALLGKSVFPASLYPHTLVARRQKACRVGGGCLGASVRGDAGKRFRRDGGGLLLGLFSLAAEFFYVVSDTEGLRPFSLLRK